MKELSIEEKAKRYDEVVEKAKNCLKDGTITNTAISYIETLIPELKESEDERIRKILYGWVCIEPDDTFKEGFTKEQILAWLEKQGKQKETLCDQCKKTQPSHSCQDITTLERCALEKQGEQKLTEFEKAVKQVMEEAIECGDTRSLKADAEMLLSLVHKSAWSEENEINLERAIWYVENPVRMVIKNSMLVEWLKELKDRVQPQSAWKPSDEQVKAVKEAACYSSVFSEKTIDNLISLSKDLKKLKG